VMSPVLDQTANGAGQQDQVNLDLFRCSTYTEGGAHRALISSIFGCGRYITDPPAHLGAKPQIGIVLGVSSYTD